MIPRERLRRLAAILAFAAYVVPWIPRVFGPPLDRHHFILPDGRGECLFLSAVLMLLGLFAAAFGRAGADRGSYWTRVLVVGFFWYASLAFVPI